MLKCAISTVDVPLLFTYLPAELRAELVLYAPLETLLVLAELPRFKVSPRELRTSRTSVCNWAAECGYLSLLAWASQQGALLSFSAWGHAAKGGHLEVLEWLLARGVSRGHRDLPVTLAAGAGHLNVLKWLERHDFLLSTDARAHAAGAGHVHVLDWLEGRLLVKDTRVCGEAARGGHVRVLAWARTRGYPLDKYVARGAAVRGQTEALEWLVLNGCPYDVFECRIAAEAGKHVALVALIDEIMEGRIAPWTRE